MDELPFIGRKIELKGLVDLTKKKAASLVVIRGRRRIGKSRLVRKFAEKYRFLSFSGLPPADQTTEQSQRKIFAEQLANNLKLPPIQSEDWVDLFSFLARETKTGRTIILLDEISWIGSKDPDFLGKLKNAWDLEFKKNPELILILCGSVSVWIEKNILRNTGFVGRLSWVLDLEELSIQESNELLMALKFRGDAYEKFKILAVTGGIPRYLEEIKPDRLADENIKSLCFVKEGVLFREFQEIFVDIFAKRSETYKKIVAILVDGDKDLSHIAEQLNIGKSGHLSHYLNDLIQSGFIKCDKTWNIKDNKISNLGRYRLSDNYLRFYLKYIEKNKMRIERKLFEKSALSALPSFDTIMGLQFENLVLNNRTFIWKNLRIYPEDIITDNPYFQKPQLRKKGCQIDYLIQTRAKVLYLCEIKFSKQPIKSDVIDALREKQDRFSLPRGFSLLPVLIHVNGVSESLVDAEYFSHIIDFSDFLQHG
jgi:AAA+ ATPase superfamily predicted ATPase